VAIVIDVGVVRGGRVASNGDVIRRHILPRHNTGNEVERSDDKNQQNQHGGESSPAREMLTLSSYLRLYLGMNFFLPKLCVYF
jgi:hypothetical protein